MKVKDLMTHHSTTCTMDTNLEQAGLAMWNGDFGVMPVLDDEQRVIGIITDRDIAMATALQRKSAAQISVRDVAHQANIVTCAAGDEIERALQEMETHKIRRLPVIDGDGHLQGMVSLADIAAYTSGGRKSACTATRLVGALKSIATPHTEEEKLVSRA